MHVNVHVNVHVQYLQVNDLNLSSLFGCTLETLKHRGQFSL